MPKMIEEKLHHCSSCSRRTVHVRNNSKRGAVAVIVHVALVIATAGLWLVPLVAWSIMTAKIGGWSCRECGK